MQEAGQSLIVGKEAFQCTAPIEWLFERLLSPKPSSIGVGLNSSVAGWQHSFLRPHGTQRNLTVHCMQRLGKPVHYLYGFGCIQGSVQINRKKPLTRGDRHLNYTVWVEVEKMHISPVLKCGWRLPMCKERAERRRQQVSPHLAWTWVPVARSAPNSRLITATVVFRFGFRWR